MMSKIKVVLLALVAVFALGAITANASAAEPEFLVLFECLSQTNGDYLKQVVEGTQKHCIELSNPANTGPFEADTGTGLVFGAGDSITFSSLSNLSILREAGGNKVECEKEENTLPNGDITGPKHILVKLRFFTNCLLNALGGGECQNKGAGTKEIETEHLKGWLFFIKEAAPLEVGVFYTAETGEKFAEFNCADSIIGNQKILVESALKTEYEAGGEFLNGSCVTSKVEPVSTGPTDAGRLITTQTGNVQNFKLVKYEGHEFECELVITVNTNPLEKATQEEEGGTVVVFDEPVEVLG